MEDTILVVYLLLCLYNIVLTWILFDKAGRPGWASIVPIYNAIVALDVAKMSAWYFLLMFIPVVNIYAFVKFHLQMARVFGRSSMFGVGCIFLSPIFYSILAFSDNQYIGDEEYDD